MLSGRTESELFTVRLGDVFYVFIVSFVLELVNAIDCLFKEAKILPVYVWFSQKFITISMFMAVLHTHRLFLLTSVVLSTE